MKHFILHIFVISFIIYFASSVGFTQEISNHNCSGNWKLSNPTHWVAINDKGQIIPFSPNTTIYGCGKKPIILTEDFDGAAIDIICQPSEVKDGIPNIVSATIICK